MALVINDAATVATGMSPIVDSALAADSIFIDGVSFSSEHDIGNAGQIQVVVDSLDTVEPGVPGANFSNTEYANTVVDININNSFKKSDKVPSYFENTMPVELLMQKTLHVTESVRVGRQKSILAYVVDSLTAADDTDALTAANLVTKVTDARAALRKNHCNPNVIIASVDTYTLMLKVAGTQYTPVKNDEIIRTGRIGYWLGILWIEADLLDGSSSYKYLDADGDTETVDCSAVDFIMYQYDKLAVVDRLDGLRVKESESFFGSLVQEEVVAGFKIKNANAFYLKTTVASDNANASDADDDELVDPGDPETVVDEVTDVEGTP